MRTCEFHGERALRHWLACGYRMPVINRYASASNLVAETSARLRHTPCRLQALGLHGSASGCNVGRQCRKLREILRYTLPLDAGAGTTSTVSAEPQVTRALGVANFGNTRIGNRAL